MNETRLHELLRRFSALHALVVGDFFLDRYLLIDPALAERSLETGLEARQVVEVRATPGAAGTVTANLRALGLRVSALGVVGDDGEGYELRQGLRALGVADDELVVAPARRTPTYTKPIVTVGGAPPRELERLDIRTRAPLPGDVTEALIGRLSALVSQVDIVIIADQMPEAEHGAITGRVRTELARLAAVHPAIWFLVDSRERIGLFEGLILKPNAREAVRAVFPEQTGEPGEALARQAATELLRRSGRMVFVTLGAGGMLVLREGGAMHVPGVPVTGPIDVVGAGDSAMAAIAAGLGAGAEPEEAALLGNLAAAVTIQQLGTTGTASPQQIVDQWRAYH